MTAICLTFDTLDFVKKLEAVGIEPKVAEVWASLQAELQTKVLEKQMEADNQILNKFEEYRPILDELKITKNELATKSDILKLDYKIDNVKNELKTNLDSKVDNLCTKLKADINGLRNELVIKLGSMIGGAIVILIGAMALLH